MRRLLLLLVVLLLACALAPQARAQLIADVVDTPVALEAPQVERAGKRASYTYESAAVAEAFTGVAVQGVASGSHFEAQIRFETPGGWTAWRDLYVVRSSTDPAFLAAYRSDTLRQHQPFELRFVVEDGADVTLVGAGVFNTRNDIDRTGGAPPEAGIGSKTLDHVFPPMMIPRAQWGATPFRGTPIPLARPSYDHITFHHAAGFGASTLQEGVQQVFAIQDFHQNGRGWSDIGYQFVMDQSGRLYQGRPFLTGPVNLEDVPTLVQGAHVGGFNTGNIGLCVLGCYHPPEGPSCQDTMTPAALDSLVTMFAFLSEAYGVPEQEIMGHRDFGSTACPGDTNYALLPAIRERVAELKRTGNRPLGTATLAATSDDDGVVRLDWQFIRPGDIAAYRIERVYQNQAAVVFEGTALEPEGFVDGSVSQTGDVTYRLVGMNAAGREQILAVAEVTVEAPASFVLAHNFPNPFRDETTIRYFLEEDGIVTLDVYDVTGRRVALLEDAFKEHGRWYSQTFDGRDLPGGTYFYRIQVDGFGGIVYDKTRAVTLIR